MMNIPNVNANTLNVNTTAAATQPQQPQLQAGQVRGTTPQDNQTPQAAPAQANLTTPEADRLQANLRQLQVQQRIIPATEQQEPAPQAETQPAATTTPAAEQEPAPTPPAAESETPAPEPQAAQPVENVYAQPNQQGQNPLLDMIG